MVEHMVDHFTGGGGVGELVLGWDLDNSGFVGGGRLCIISPIVGVPRRI